MLNSQAGVKHINDPGLLQAIGYLVEEWPSKPVFFSSLQW